VAEGAKRLDMLPPPLLGHGEEESCNDVVSDVAIKMEENAEQFGFLPPLTAPLHFPLPIGCGH